MAEPGIHQEERESVTAGEREDSCVFLMNTWVLSSSFCVRKNKKKKKKNLNCHLCISK